MVNNSVLHVFHFHSDCILNLFSQSSLFIPNLLQWHYLHLKISFPFMYTVNDKNTLLKIKVLEACWAKFLSCICAYICGASWKKRNIDLSNFSMSQTTVWKPVLHSPWTTWSEQLPIKHFYKSFWKKVAEMYKLDLWVNLINKLKT